MRLDPPDVPGTTGARRVRMTGPERREQLVGVGRRLFAERGYDGTSVEEVAAVAGVSKPVVYEHFGGKEGLYAVVVERETSRLLERVRAALSTGSPRQLVERATLALLGYIEDDTDGFRILVRDRPLPGSSGEGSFASLLSEVVRRVEHILAEEFETRGFDPATAPLHAQALVGMVAMTGQWWLEVRSPPREVVAAHLVTLAYSGLSALDPDPHLIGDRPATAP